MTELYYGPYWITKAKTVRKRDNYQCQACGIKQCDMKYTLHVHHIIPLRTFGRNYKKANELSNLITLCPVCHKHIEKRGIGVLKREPNYQYNYTTTDPKLSEILNIPLQLKQQDKNHEILNFIHKRIDPVIMRLDL